MLFFFPHNRTAVESVLVDLLMLRYQPGYWVTSSSELITPYLTMATSVWALPRLSELGTLCI